MTYSVVFSQAAEETLAAVSARDPGRARQLALILLRLEQAPCPPGSRDLGDGDRTWAFAGHSIAYHVDDKRRVIEIGMLREGPLVSFSKKAVP